MVLPHRRASGDVGRRGRGGAAFAAIADDNGGGSGDDVSGAQAAVGVASTRPRAAGVDPLREDQLPRGGGGGTRRGRMSI